MVHVTSASTTSGQELAKSSGFAARTFCSGVNRRGYNLTLAWAGRRVAGLVPLPSSPSLSSTSVIFCLHVVKTG